MEKHVPYKMSYTKNIGFFGVPSSGKTTTAHDLLYELARKTPMHSNTALFVPEYARIFIQKRGRPPQKSSEQLYISREQSFLERHLEQLKPKYLICETPVHSGLAYMKWYFPESTRDYEKLQEISSWHKYDYVFYFTRLNYKNDRVRYQTEEDLVNLETLLKTGSSLVSSRVVISKETVSGRISTVPSFVLMAYVGKAMVCLWYVCGLSCANPEEIIEYLVTTPLIDCPFIFK